MSIRLVANRGTHGVTIEEICAEADVSPRTFFNYYPNKLAAVFGLVVVRTSPEQEARFVDGNGDLFEDACTFVAETIPMPTDWERIGQLLNRRSELKAEFWTQVATRLRPLQPLIERRTHDQDVARLVLGAVAAAVNSAVARSRVSGEALTAPAILAEIDALGDLLAGRAGPRRGPLEEEEHR
ncbi:MAG: TetR/AcrR family transcriptional regulator [Propionibacteriaceae bacterium]|nr:TetR/AcrR family transcriptional regulator [Propionibacteriaceae bacterium]